MEQLPGYNKIKSIVKRGQSENTTFFDGYRPIHYFSRVFGLMPFSIVYDSDGKAQRPKIYKRDFLWLMILIFVYSTILYINSQNIKLVDDPNLNSSILVLGDKLLNVLILICGILFMGINMCNRFKLVNILNNFATFDEEVASYGDRFDYKRDIRRAWLYCITVTVACMIYVTVVYFVYSYYKTDASALNLISFYGSTFLQYSTPTAPLIFYIFSLCKLRERFAALNHILRDQFLNGNRVETSSNSTSIQKDHLIDTIKLIGRQHSFLTDIMDQINFCCSFQMMVNCAVTFGFTILTFYTMYRLFFQQNDFFRELSWVYVVCDLLFITFTLIAIYIADRVSDEGKEISRILQDIINCTTDSDVTASLAQMSLQVQFRYPVASCGIFTFDWNLVFSMGAATTIYLTIILGFDPSQIADRI